MTVDHEQLVLEAAAAILRSRGEHERADLLASSMPPKRTRKYRPGPEASILQKRLFERMEEAGHNQYSLSMEAGTGADFVRQVLNGKSKDPGVRRMARVAKVLGTSSDYLIGETDKP